MSNGKNSKSARKPFKLMLEYQSTNWWFWLMTVVLLTAGVCGWPRGFQLALGLTVFQLALVSIGGRSLRAFPVQVRLGYLLLLLIAAPARFHFIYWIPTMGTWAQVLFGYCAMARTVSLMPWNRRAPFSWSLLKHTVSAAPVRGSFLPTDPTSGQPPWLTACAKPRATRRTGV